MSAFHRLRPFEEQAQSRFLPPRTNQQPDRLGRMRGLIAFGCPSFSVVDDWTFGGSAWHLIEMKSSESTRGSQWQALSVVIVRLAKTVSEDAAKIQMAGALAAGSVRSLAKAYVRGRIRLREVEIDPEIWRAASPSKSDQLWAIGCMTVTPFDAVSGNDVIELYNISVALPDVVDFFGL